MESSNRLDKTKVRKSFDRAAHSYDTSAILQNEIAKRLLARLDYIRIQPDTILDLGCGTGNITVGLLKKYPKSKLIALDLAINMLKKTKQHGSKWFGNKPRCVCADAENLPFKENSVDLIISNFMLQWCNDLQQTFTGFQRVVSENGLLLFTTFGPDTMKELRAAWSEVDNTPHVSQFVDMHDIGDALLQAGFSDPVMDMEMITMTYESVGGLMKDIKNIGATNAVSARSKGLMGKQRLQAFATAYDKFKMPDGQFPLSWEVVYGHAWAPAGLKVDDFDKVIQIHKGS